MLPNTLGLFNSFGCTNFKATCSVIFRDWYEIAEADQLILQKIKCKEPVLELVDLTNDKIRETRTFELLVKVGKFKNPIIIPPISIEIDPMGRIADLLIYYKADLIYGLACGAVVKGLGVLASHENNLCNHIYSICYLCNSIFKSINCLCYGLCLFSYFWQLAL